MAELAHRSPWSLHRLFGRVTGETPRGYHLRVRLDRAAAQLVSTDHQVSRIAFDHGFASHEVFTRSFTSRFGVSPTAYRARGLVGADDDRIPPIHAAVATAASPCVGLYRMSTTNTTTSSTNNNERAAMPIDAQVKELPALTALVISRRTTREEIPTALGECLPQVFGYAMQEGLAITGPPMARYPEMGMASLVIECGVTVAEPPESEPAGDIEVRTIPAGSAVVTIHHGSYDTLHSTYAAIEEWIGDNGYAAAGPPHEVYLTDPGEHPDPATWQTEITQPVAKRS